MTKHLSGEALVAHYYQDSSARERREASEHLCACRECALRMRELTSFLSAIEAPQVPERGENYGVEVWNRIRAHLPDREKRSWWAPLPASWKWGTAVAAMIIVAFLVGRFLQPRPTQLPIVAVTKNSAPEKVKERLLLVALDDHLEKSQMVLVELANAPESGGPVNISVQQQQAEELVDSSRLYRQTAREVGELATAKVLDELERTLVEIVHSPRELSQADLKRIQERIHAQGLIFKVRVINAKVRRERTPKANEGTGAAPSQPGKTI